MQEEPDQPGGLTTAVSVRGTNEDGRKGERRDPGGACVQKKKKRETCLAWFFE